MIKINAVEMVRKIRDKQFEEIKNKTPQELKRYFEKKSRWAFSGATKSALASSKN
jgi:hypothetical protein